MIALFISDFGHIKDVVGTTRLNRPSLKVTSPESPNTQKTQKNAMQISGRIQVSLLNFPLLFFFYYDLYMSNTVVPFRAIFCVILQRLHEFMIEGYCLLSKDLAVVISVKACICYSNDFT